jgi:ribonuclease G
MTRKRVRQDLQSLFCAPCPTCKGSGVVKSDVTLAAEIFRKVQAAALEPGGEEIVIRVHPEMAQHLAAEEREGMELLQETVQRKLSIQPLTSLDREEYEIISR